MRWIGLLCVAVISVAEMAASITRGDILSFQTKVNGQPVSQPVVRLGTADCLAIEFDQLADDFEYLSYRVIHLNANGKNSVLTPAEYTRSGFNLGKVEDFEYSVATNTPYVHYRFSLPNNNISFSRSGRYRVEIFLSETPDSLVATTDVYVVEPVANITPTVSPRTDIDFMSSHQQLEIKADIGKLGLTNPASELILVVDQNSRTGSERMIPVPTRITPTEVGYSHLSQLVFSAGNEYRRFETTSLHRPNPGVGTTEYSMGLFTVSTADSLPRDKYFFDKTQHGSYAVRTTDSYESSDIAADYVAVRFKLRPNGNITGKVFVEGDLTCRRLDSSSEMIFNPETRMFEKTLLLKQGSYNFLFVTDNHDNPFELESSFHQTSNIYNIKLYCRRPHDRADSLIGFATVGAE